MFKLFRSAGLGLAVAGLSVQAALAETAAAVSPNASLWDAINPYVSQGASWIAGAAITLAAAQVTRYTGLQIRQTWLDKVHSAADTGVSVALSQAEGAVDQAQVVDKGVAWVQGNLAPTLRKLGMSPEQLKGIVVKQLGKAILSGLGPKGAAAENPAMARAAGNGPMAG